MLATKANATSGTAMKIEMLAQPVIPPAAAAWSPLQ
jgi:hypothetical protein